MSWRVELVPACLHGELCELCEKMKRFDKNGRRLAGKIGGYRHIQPTVRALELSDSQPGLRL
jgi:hypothetical protein